MLRSFLLAVLAASAGSAPALGDRGSSGFLSPSAQARLESGTSVEVAWSLPSDGVEFDEMELVLSLDGGRSFPVRVTADVSRASEGLVWRVPAMVTEHARLALRTGLNEQVDSEVIQFLGPEFSIVRATGDPLEELFRVKGELRTREALASPADPPFEAALGDAPAGQMSAAPETSRAAELPRSFALPLGSGSVNAARPSESTPRPIARVDRVLRPLSIPLRQ